MELIMMEQQATSVCSFSRADHKENFLEIERYKYWTIFLHEHQCYLGRVYLLANHNQMRDFMEIHKYEQEEFFQTGHAIKSAFKNLFAPDLVNYAMLSNKFEKLHVHIIPRYKKYRFFHHVKFVDSRWGQNYAPYDKYFALPDEVRISIRDAIKEELFSLALSHA